ncbi:MAG: peptidoglycan DD-metalloendopeptidase family protein [Candidatus Zixiibacteriota bacterium]
MADRKFLLLAVLLLCAANAPAAMWPVWPDSTNHQISATYGLVQNEIYLHSGIDIAVPEGTAVYAVESGYVKAIITINDSDSGWRIAIADSAGTAVCDGWMYAHVDKYNIYVMPGQWVEAGTMIATVVGWDDPTIVRHLHFSRIRFQGTQYDWSNGFWDWEFIDNPLLYMENIYDPDPPVLDLALNGQLFGFCSEGYPEYFAADEPLSGDVNIICSAYDYVNFYQWKSVPYKLEYKIEGDSSIPWTTTVCFNEPMGSYNGYMCTYKSIIYQDDGYCNTSFTADSQAMFFNLTNTDSDGTVEPEDLLGCWHTTDFRNGEYWVYARATDHVGSITVDSMQVRLGNFFELSGTIMLQGNSALEGTIITAVENGACDTTDETGHYAIPDVGIFDQLITVRRPGFAPFDTTIVMDQNFEFNKTLLLDYICGDANGNGALNILDVTYLITYLYKGGPEPVPMEGGDANGNGAINILDVTYLITYLYKSGPAPVCPGI